MDSHISLPEDERFLKIYKLYAVTQTPEEKNTIEKPHYTTDEKIYKIAENKENTLNSFLFPMQEVAFDCELFKEQNMVTNKYSCFIYIKPLNYNFNIFILAVY